MRRADHSYRGVLPGVCVCVCVRASVCNCVSNCLCVRASVSNCVCLCV